MADKYLKDFDAESPNLTDYIIMTGGTGNDSDYKTLSSAMAQLLIETYAGSTLAGSQQSIQSALSDVNKEVTSFNNYNLLSKMDGVNRTYNGVTFSWDKANGTITASGTASAQAFANLYSDQNELPDGIIPDCIYQFLMDQSSVLEMRIGFYNGSTSLGAKSYKGNALVQIPSAATGMYIRANVQKNAVVNESVHFAMLNTKKSKHLKLEAGTFTVKEIVMLDGMTIEGSGNATILKVDAEDSTSFAIKMQKGCTLKDIKILGQNGNDWTPDGTITSAHGVLVNTYGNTEGTRNRIQISGIEISGFSGGGICFDSTGVNYDNSANVSNAFIHNNNVGIYIPKKAEYNRICNAECARNYWGCINNGGNNLFSNCGFNGNVTALLMDSTGITSPANDSHGSFAGCNFNHTHAFDNNTSLIAINLIGQSSGELFSACTVAYGAISISDSSGIVFANCNFLSDSAVTVSNGGLTLFDGCVYKSASVSPLTKTGSAVVKYADCYTWAGVPYDPAS